jgi:hypothetical protein
MAYKKGQKVTILVHGAGVVSEEKNHVVAKVSSTHIILEGLEEAPFNVKTLQTPVMFAGFWYEIVKDGAPHVVSAPTKVVKKIQAKSKSEAKRIAIQTGAGVTVRKSNTRRTSPWTIERDEPKAKKAATTTVVNGHDGKRVKLTQKQMERRYGNQLSDENSVRGAYGR